MSTEVLPQTPGYTAKSGQAEASAAPRHTIPPAVARRGWGKRLLVTAGLAAVIAPAATVYLHDKDPDKLGTRLTHTIGRDDLQVTVTEQGQLESSNNTEIKCKVRGTSTVLWVIEAGTEVKPGDELVRLDTSTIEDNINQQEIVYQRALATFAQSTADVAVAKIAITEYEEGVFRAAMKTLEKDLAIAESNLRTAKNMLDHSRLMFKRGYVSELEVEGNEFTVTQGQLELELKRTEIDVLQRFTRAKQLEEFKSALAAAEAKLASDKAALDLEKDRLDREKQQLENCLIVAEAGGMVIHPSAAEWKSTPDIEEGATVREDQVLLMIPDLTKMQVKVGIHESKVESIKPGMPARITIQEMTLHGKVASVASVTKPAGWWTGNVVKYDTIIALESYSGLKPGMSAEVEVTLASHENELTIPVAAVVETDGQYFCWVKTADGAQRRGLQLGDSNDQFIVVQAGLKEGDDVVLNPIAFIEEAQTKALQPLQEQSPPQETATAQPPAKSQPAKPVTEAESSAPKKKDQ